MKNIFLTFLILCVSISYGQIIIDSSNVSTFNSAGQGDLYITSDTNEFYIGIETGKLRKISNPNEVTTIKDNGDNTFTYTNELNLDETISFADTKNWLLTGNTGNSSTSFLGTTDDVKMQIRSNNLPLLEFGRRQTLGLIQTYPGYEESDQPLVYLGGDGKTSAMQFAASGASFYKPMFYTTSNGSFRLKGSSGSTDMFEIGSAGTNNNGRLEFIVGDDGTEPIIFKRYNYYDKTNRELFRVQGSVNSTGAKPRFGINLNPGGITLDETYNTADTGDMANSTFQVNGSVSKSIFTTTANLTLTEDHHTIILGGNHAITLPGASTCTGRIYVIKNKNAAATTVSSYTNNLGAVVTTIQSNSSLTIQSDGSKWEQITNDSGSTSTSQGWSLTGNSIATSNFLGSTNDQDLVFKTFNTESGRISVYQRSTAFGYNATAAYQGTTMGREAVVGGNSGVAVGYQAKASNQNSTVVGALAEGNSNNTTAYGYQAKALGQNSTAIGANATVNSNNQNSNAFGYNAKVNNTSYVTNATAIGTSASVSANNSTAVGYNTLADKENTVILGNNANIGIGTSDPTERLQVNGSVKIVDGTQGAGKVLTSDANGKATWENNNNSITVYTGSFIISATGNITITGIPFQPSQATFVAYANIESFNIDTTGSSANDIANSFGGMNGFARSDSGTILQRVIYVGGSGQSINNISRFSSNIHCIGLRYSNQDGASLGKTTAKITSFNTSGFTLNVDNKADNVVVLFTAYK